MKRTIAHVLAAAACTLGSSSAFAASDYLLVIDGVKGEASTPIQVESWSFGVCNAGQCTASAQHTIVSPRDAASGLPTGRRTAAPRDAASGLATGKRQHEPISVSSPGADAGARTGNWDIKKATKRTIGCDGGGSGCQVNVAAGDVNGDGASETTKVSSGLHATGSAVAQGAAIGDVDGDGSPDFAYSAGQDAIYGLSFTVDTMPPVVTAACSSGHIDSATLTRGDESYAVSSVSVVCTRGGSGAAAASYARTADSTPARISTNVTVPKQTQGATFGEKVQSGMAGGGSVTMTLTGGQMKHTKTGHVTLLK